MKDFSIVLPTRGSRRDVLQMLNSLERTTLKKKELEVLFAIDTGKTVIIDQVKKEKYQFDIKFFERDKTKNFSEDYYNWLGNKSEGLNIMCFNDDAYFLTQGWDEIIREQIIKHRWSIYLIDTFDTTKTKKGNNFCTFPMFPRKAFNVLGYLLHPKIRMYPADHIAYQLYSAAGRIIDCNKVIIEHDHVHELDPSKSYMWDIFQEDLNGSDKRLDLRDDLLKLLEAGRGDLGPKPKGKLSKILDIVRS